MAPEYMEQINQPLPEMDNQLITAINPASFPLPDRADTFARPLSEADAAVRDQLGEFAQLQAAAATDLLEVLTTLENSPTREDWAAAYDRVTLWRAGLQPAGFGRGGIERVQGRIVVPITDAEPNRDRIGEVGRLRAGSSWSDEAQAWVGGQPTPSSDIAAQAGSWVLERFEAEGVHGDALQNIVRLPDGTQVNGNLMIRGEAARNVAQDLKQGVAARGHDVSQFDTGGDGVMYTVTATEQDRARLFAAAMERLAELSQAPQAEVSAEDWAVVTYLLYQSPLKKKGSDAVIRTFVVAAAAHVWGRAPKLPHDIDLRAYTMGQAAFTQYLTDFIREDRP